MNHTVDIGMRLEDLIERSRHGNIDVIEIGLCTANKLNAFESFLRGVVKIVRDDHLVVRFEKSQRSERAYVAGPSVLESGMKGLVVQV